ncbi:CAAX geranylgeranyltransferase alpha subunit [Globomyces sp. JEL0801]|nr:CAAX geranylgeranyltransferase alpha subunit [Globomyces sp. JEL0801]
MIEFDSDDWKDVTPKRQDDGENPLVPIAYEEYYKTCMDYYRALSIIPEYSQRALDLTTEILTENASHYSVWKYRLDIINSLQSDLDQEWIFLNDLGAHNPKSYQIWYSKYVNPVRHQRQALSERASTPKVEIEYVNRMIEMDSKNYHAWSYRQWLVRTHNIWEAEMKESDYWIQNDVRNNSAWNHRFFILSQGPNPINTDTIQQQITFTMGMIEMAPNNESPWNFINGLLLLNSSTLDQFPELNELCLKYSNLSNRFALSALLALYESKALQQEYSETCTRLEQIDPIRAKYWKFKSNKLVSSQ